MVIEAQIERTRCLQQRRLLDEMKQTISREMHLLDYSKHQDANASPLLDTVRLHALAGSVCMLAGSGRRCQSQLIVFKFVNMYGVAEMAFTGA